MGALTEDERTGRRCIVCGRIAYKYASKPIPDSTTRACITRDCYEKATATPASPGATMSDTNQRAAEHPYEWDRVEFDHPEDCGPATKAEFDAGLGWRY